MFTTLITPAELAAHLNDPTWRVIDVRHDLAIKSAGRDAFRQSRIPGALFFDAETQLAGVHTGSNGRHPLPVRDDFAALAAQAGIGDDTQVVVVDASGGMFAARLWWMLRWIGHDKVAVLDGGFPAWQADGQAVDQTVLDEAASNALPGPGATTLSIRPPLVDTVDADAVLANLTQPAFAVLDARAGPRYRGEVEPMDPVAGHIPGALNRPYTENLTADQRFKPAEELREVFTSVLAGRTPQHLVHQCGSGITACHNLLAMEVAGLSGSRLYPGSWSEWSADTSRPVARG
jgi:thiosulfate/3-mercaptopyruvate sulfurtransferase